ncbi:hypothetical protein CTAM01_09407 [Colletotrichum tamarilloi]|uniref:Uncharacterized protein n=1 Tax=Colletotrichum tamarilloi TaxID=1209934 RepID=A0ABQ9R3R1_9PEZI|nr:uncharacterized protein CTAM01_09407 [Colletotrichum tamarilloi]KAI3536277.1 hypothetical protein CSPX01_10906 [Colletotrichum filicis]KAK1493263.1 hypothetical protein CTAM01_09407 [Colletotrichum tamarilloi]
MPRGKTPRRLEKAYYSRDRCKLLPSLTPPRSALPRATSYNGSRNQGTQRLVCDLGGIMVAQDGSSCTIRRPSGLRNTMPREQDDPHSRTPTTSWMTAVLHPGTPVCLGLPDNLTAAGPPIAPPPCCIVRTYAALLVASVRLFPGAKPSTHFPTSPSLPDSHSWR